jgi:hypothetical protein
MAKNKKNNAVMQALLDMQNDGATVKITVGEDTKKTNWVNTNQDDDYLGYLSGDISNSYSGLDDVTEYDDMELEDSYLD